MKIYSRTVPPIDPADPVGSLRRMEDFLVWFQEQTDNQLATLRKAAGLPTGSGAEQAAMKSARITASERKAVE